MGDTTEHFVSASTRDLKIYRMCLGLEPNEDVPADLLESHDELVKLCTAWTVNLSKDSIILLAHLYKKGALKSPTAVVIPKRGPGRPRKFERTPKQETVTVE